MRTSVAQCDPLIRVALALFGAYLQVEHDGMHCNKFALPGSATSILPGFCVLAVVERELAACAVVAYHITFFAKKIEGKLAPAIAQNSGDKKHFALTVCLYARAYSTPVFFENLYSLGGLKAQEIIVCLTLININVGTTICEWVSKVVAATAKVVCCWQYSCRPVPCISGSDAMDIQIASECVWCYTWPTPQRVMRGKCTYMY